MTVSRFQRALIHLAAKDRGLTDDGYRSALAQIGGISSAKDLDAEGFTAMMGCFEYAGFAPIAAKGPNDGPQKDTAQKVITALMMWKHRLRAQAAKAARCAADARPSGRRRKVPPLCMAKQAMGR